MLVATVDYLVGIQTVPGSYAERKLPFLAQISRLEMTTTPHSVVSSSCLREYGWADGMVAVHTRVLSEVRSVMPEMASELC